MTRYRTLMLEPQWHPIRWLKKHPDWLGDHFGIVVIWMIFGPIITAFPHPAKMRLWSLGRWIAFGCGCLPILLLIGLVLTVASFKASRGLRWCYHHPPVRVKTRYEGKP